MDGKGKRRSTEKNASTRRRRGTESYRKRASTFLSQHKRALLTGVLLLSMIVLLFGIFAQLPAPATSTPPSGVTVVSYSAFVGQVKNDNVLAVTFQGQGVHVLLARPYSQPQPTTSSRVAGSSPTISAEITAWSRYVSAGYPTWPNTSTPPPISTARTLYAQLPAGGDASLMPSLLSRHVTIATLPVTRSPLWLTLVWRFVPLLFLALVLALLLAPRNQARGSRSMDDRVSQLGKSRARRFESHKESSQQSRLDKTPATARKASSTPAGPGRVSIEPPATFADVAGIDEVRSELEEIVQFLQSPERFARLGARIPRGAMLVGPPGTGKTLLARAVAGEAGVPFFSMSASEFVEMFVGVGASRVRDLFNQARQVAPCVVFIDEIDAVGRKRSIRVSNNDERDQTLNQLLVELDGFDSRKAIVVLAATNRVDILDKALLRPGRFDRHIIVSHPDRAGREAILKVHTLRTPLHAEVNLARLARLTTGMTGADLANLVNEAALVAARRDMEHITHDCFEDALARVQLGALRPIVMSETDRRIIAFHEGGHALVAYHSPLADSVNRVTILPRGQSLGVTQFTCEEDRYNYSRETLLARIAVGLGGRVAEELTFGPERVTTGAENDFQVVTDLARRMVTRWGMSEQVGVVFADYSSAAAGLNMRRMEPDALAPRAYTLAAGADGRLLMSGDDSSVHRPLLDMSVDMPATRNASSASMAVLVDAEVQRILKQGHEMARAILREHYDQLAQLAETLLEREQLDRKQFEALLEA
jgi:ATP-dependent metalloprotease FtsH